jgi:DNA topoisomerase-1
MVDLTPDKVKPVLTGDQFKIYKLIWERFLASLMANCVKNTQAVDIAAGNYLFHATGYSIKFDGFTVLYQEATDEEEAAKALPELQEGAKLHLRDLTGNQHFTQPPARYNDATLTEVMEKTGIGRPSTYAATIATVIKREYVEREKKTLKPTTLGEVTTELMCELFKDIVDTKFTASMEEDLDKVASGNMTYVETLDKFYDPFMHTIEVAEKKMEGKHAKIPDEVTDELCPNCGKNMVIKTGRFGKFLACSGYPECKTTKPIVVRTPGNCPQCGKPMVERKSKRGFKYFGCEGYPECKYMTWDTPTNETCPNCGKTLFKRRGGIIGCNDESCGFEKKAQRASRKKAADDNDNE